MDANGKDVSTAPHFEIMQQATYAQTEQETERPRNLDCWQSSKRLSLIYSKRSRCLGTGEMSVQRQHLRALR